jgi:hypothetical protein
MFAYLFGHFAQFNGNIASGLKFDFALFPQNENPHFQCQQ